MTNSTASSTPSAALNDDQVRRLTEIRDHILVLSAYEFACDRAVQRLTRKRLVLEFAGVALAVGVLYILYLLKSNADALVQGPVHDVVSIVGATLSIFVLVATVWVHMAKWDQQVEVKQRLSRDLRALIATLEDLRSRRDASAAPFGRAEKERLRIVQERKHSLAMVARSDLRAAHRHVAIKNHSDSVKCHQCGREWRTEYARQHGCWRLVPGATCLACGVKYAKVENV